MVVKYLRIIIFVISLFGDSGMIPWLLIAELVSKSERSLEDLVAGINSLPSQAQVKLILEWKMQILQLIVSWRPIVQTLYRWMTLTALV